MSQSIAATPKALLPFAVIVSPIVIGIPFIGFYRGLWSEAAKIAIASLPLFMAIAWLVLSQKIVVTEKSVLTRGPIKKEDDRIPLSSIEFGLVVPGRFFASTPKRIEFYGPMDASGEYPRIGTIELQWFGRTDIEWLITHPKLKVRNQKIA